MAEVVNIFTKEVTPPEEVVRNVNEDLITSVAKLTEEFEFTEFILIAANASGDMFTTGSQELRRKDALWLIENARASALGE